MACIVFEPNVVVCAIEGTFRPRSGLSVPVDCDSAHVAAQGPTSAAPHALTVRLLWTLWIAVEKAYKAPPRFTYIFKAVPRRSSSGRLPRRNWIVARNSPCSPRNSLQRAALLGFHRSAESTLGAFAITQIVVKSGEKSCVIQAIGSLTIC
jgi:hypothetical protein